MRIFRVLLLIGLVMASGVFRGKLFAEKTPDEVLTAVSPYVLNVTAFQEEKNTFQKGLGVIIDKLGTVVASRHLFLDFSRSEVKSKAYGFNAVSGILGQDKQFDLVLLEVKFDQELPVLEIVDYQPTINETIYIVGEDKQARQRIITANIFAILPGYDDSPIYEIHTTSNIVRRGSIITNIEGQPFGLISFPEIGYQDRHFAVSLDIAKRVKHQITALSDFQIEPLKEILYAKGLFLLNKKSYQNALFFFNRINEIDPEYKQVQLKRGLAFLGQKEYQSALDSFLIALEKNPEDADLTYYTGLTYKRQEDYPNAVDYLAQTVDLKSDDLAALEELAAVYLVLEQYENAIKILTKMVPVHPVQAPIYKKLGRSYEAIKDEKTAIKAYRRSLKIDPAQPDLYDIISQIYIEKEVFLPALNILRKWQAQEPSNNVVTQKIKEVEFKYQKFLVGTEEVHHRAYLVLGENIDLFYILDYVEKNTIKSQNYRFFHLGLEFAHAGKKFYEYSAWTLDLHQFSGYAMPTIGFKLGKGIFSFDYLLPYIVAKIGLGYNYLGNEPSIAQFHALGFGIKLFETDHLRLACEWYPEMMVGLIGNPMPTFISAETQAYMFFQFAYRF